MSWADTASAALSLDAGHKLRDDAGEEAPDVAVLAFSPQDWHEGTPVFGTSW